MTRSTSGIKLGTFLLWGGSANRSILCLSLGGMQIQRHLLHLSDPEATSLLFICSLVQSLDRSVLLLCVSVSLLKTEFLLFIKVQLIFQIIWCIITGEANYSSSTHCWKNVTQYNYILGKGQLSVTLNQRSQTKGPGTRISPYKSPIRPSARAHIFGKCEQGHKF